MTTEWLLNFLNSNFSAALWGALAGAYAAQRIGKRAKAKDDLVAEIRNTNRAITLAGAICNSYLELKTQHVKPMKDIFDKERINAQAHLAAHQRGIDGEFHFAMDMKALTMMVSPISRLSDICHEKLDLNGRPLSLVSALNNAIEATNFALLRRNEIIQQYKQTELSDSERLTSYFGLPAGRHVDQIHSDTLDQIYSSTDDAIQFSFFLCDDLAQHGRGVLRALERQFRDYSHNVNTVDFSEPKRRGMMPDEDKYSSWRNMFVKLETRKKGPWWHRIRDWLKKS